MSPVNKKKYHEAHLLILRRLWTKAKTRAKRDEISVTELVHRALRVYLDQKD